MEIITLPSKFIVSGQNKFVQLDENNGPIWIRSARNI